MSARRVATKSEVQMSARIVAAKSEVQMSARRVATADIHTTGTCVLLIAANAH